MKKNVGLIASSIGHVALLAWAVISLPAPQSHDNSDLEILPIDLVSISDVTDIRKGKADAEPSKELKEEIVKAPEPKEPPPKPAPKIKPKPVETKQEKAPEPTPAPPEPEPVKQPIAEPEPVPQPEPEPKVEEKVEEAKPVVPNPVAALPQRKPKPPKRTKPKVEKPKQPKKKAFDADAIKALANKAEQAAPASTGTDDQKASFGSRNGNQAAAMTLSELDALRSQIAQCWSPPVGAADASQLRVRIEFGLDRQGNVNAGPEPVEFPATQFGLAAVESAMRAVRRCAPYDLPAEKYSAWRRVRITFDPQEMF